AGSTALSLLVTLCMLTGQALTYSDVVSEFNIIRREHRTGTVTLAVLLSKWLVFAVAAVAQAALITAVFLQIRPGPVHSLFTAPGGERCGTLAAMRVAAMPFGLLISGLANKLKQAVALATGASIAQIALNGAAANLSNNPVLGALAWPLPARWGLAA